MTYPLPQDGYDTSTLSAIGSSDTTIYVAALPSVTSGVLTIFEQDGRTIREKVYFTATGGSGTATSPYYLTVTRGIRLIPSSGQVLFTSDSTLQKSHGASRRIALTDNIHYAGLAMAILNGSQEAGGVIKNPSSRTISDPRHLLDKEYGDALAAAAGGITSFYVAQNGADPSLTINIGAGYFNSGTEIISYAGGSAVAVTPSQTNYVQLDWNGTLLINTTGFLEGYLPLAEVVTSASDITGITDRRPWITSLGAFDKIITDRYTVGATLSAKDPVYFDAATSKLKKALAAAEATALTFQGIILDAAVDTDTGKRVQLFGPAIDITTGLTPGSMVYVTDAGGYSNTRGTYALPIGIAISDTSAFLIPPTAITNILGITTGYTISDFNTALAAASAGGSIKSYTNGESFTIPAGKVVVVNSSGNMELSDYSAVTSIGSAAVMGSAGNGVAARQSTTRSKIFKKNSTRAFHVCLNDASVTDEIQLKSIDFNPASTTVPTFSSALSTTATVANNNFDAVQLDSDTVLYLYEDGSGNLSVKVAALSSSGAPTGGSAQIVKASGAWDNSGGASLVKISATSALIFYRVSGTGIRAQILSISGTTVTTGSEQTVISSANTLIVRASVHFDNATSTYYFVLWYYDSTGTTAYIAGGSLTGTTITMGTPVSASGASGLGELQMVDSTTVLWAYTHSDGSVNLRTITISGVTVTAGSNTQVSASGAVASSWCSLEKLGTYTFCVGFVNGTGNVVTFAFYGIYTIASVITLVAIGSSQNTAADELQAVPRAVAYSPGYVLFTYANYDSGSTDDNWKGVMATMTSNLKKAIGVTLEAAATGVAGRVYIGPRMAGLSGLTPGGTYYADLDGGVFNYDTAEILDPNLKSTADSSTSLIKRN